MAPALLFLRVAEALQVAPGRARGRNVATPLPAPAEFQRPPSGSGQPFEFRAPEETPEPSVRLEAFEIVYAVAARKLQQQQRHEHLEVRVALAPLAQGHMLLDGLPEAQHLHEVEVGSETSERRLPILQSLGGLVLERKRALCHSWNTPLLRSSFLFA